MEDVILDAKMSNQELINSIDNVLNSASTRFDSFINDTNMKLGTIGSGLGTSVSTNINGQIDAILLKVKELDAQLNNLGRKSTSANSSTQTSIVTPININDLNRATELSKDFVMSSGNVDSNIKSINKNISSLRLARQATTEEKITLETLKRQQILEKERVIRGQITNESQKAIKIESLYRISTGGQTYSSAMAMSANSIQERTEKIKALQLVQANLSSSNANYSDSIKAVNMEMRALKNANIEASTAGIQLEQRNNKLATSFENLGRRVMFYTGLAAVSGFVKQLYEVRGEYELIEKSMGALLNDPARGTQIFNQIQTQALKSPYTVLDLAGATKQLIAYNFAEDEVVETTKRVADVSSALGVPIERLIYNLGQIKAQGSLTARDARDFANAGFAIVPMLAELYTEQKRFGEQSVTTAEVYNMMTKKMVSYGDVMSVIGKATSDGGMFFNYQEKQASSLNAQLSNLLDAWNMTLNQIGRDNQGVLVGSVSATRSLLLNWRQLSSAILGVIAIVGLYKGTQLAANMILGQGSMAALARVKAENALAASMLRREAAMANASFREIAFTNLATKATASQYAQALSIQKLNKLQLLLVANFALFNKELRTAALTTYGENMGRLSAFIRLASVSAKMLVASIMDLSVALLSNPMVWVTGIIAAFTYFQNKADKSKEQLQEINKSFNDLQKNIADLSFKFNVEIKKEDFNQAKEQLNELLKIAKEQFNITFNVDTSQLDNGKIVEKFHEIKTELEQISSVSRIFEQSESGTDFGEALETYGKNIQDVYDIILSNKSIVIDALEKHIAKLKELGYTTKQYANEQNSLNELTRSRGENESQLAYIIRLKQAYDNLGIIGNKTSLFDQSTDALRRLGIGGYETFTTLYNESKELTDSYGEVKKSYVEFKDELSKKIDLTTIPKEERKILLEASINKYSTDKNLNEFSRQVFLALANEDFKVDISLAPKEDSFGKTKKGLTEWQQKLQNWADKNKINLGITFTIETTESQVAEEALQSATKARADIGILSRKKGLGLATQADVEKATKEYAEKLKIAEAAGSDVSSLLKKDDVDVSARAKKVNKALSEESKAIKDELDLIDKLSNNFDKLTKEGLSSTDSISLLSNEYKKTIDEINKVLAKEGLSGFDIKDFAGKNSDEILKFLEKQRENIKKGAKVDAKKALDIKISELKVEAKTFDLSQITSELQTKLSNIKEEYELGVELQAEPEQIELFSNIFQINKDDIQKMTLTAKEAAKQIFDEINASIDAYNKTNKGGKQLALFNPQWSKNQQYLYFKEAGINAESAFAKGLAGGSKQYQEILTKDYKETQKQYEELLQKYGEYEYDKKEIQKTSAKERLSLIDKFGTEEESKEALDISNRIKISDDPKVVSDLQQQLADLVDKISANKKQIIPIAESITKKNKSELAGVEVSKFKDSDLYIQSFEDLGRIGETTLNMLYEKLETLSKSPDLDFHQVREMVRQMKSVRAELQATDALGTVVNGLKEWKKAQKELADAQNEVNYAKTTENIKKLADAENRLKEAQEKVKSGLEAIKNGFETFASLGNQTINMLKDLAGNLGITFSDDTNMVLNDMSEAFGIVSAALGVLTVAEEAAAIAGTTLMATLWPLLAVTAVLTAAFVLFGSENAKIDKQIKESELSVKKLENAYKLLDRNVNQAMGDEEIGAKKAAAANKKLELVELNRQLQLEESRSSKKKDQSKIEDLKGQIIDLQNEIADLTDSIVTDLLGISSVKDVAESVVSDMISAFKNGEDYMAVYEDSFSDMIDNMIMKAVISGVIGDRIEKMVSDLQEKIDAKGEVEKSALAIATSNASKSIDDIAKDLEEERAQNIMSYVKSQKPTNNQEYTKILKDAYELFPEATADEIEEIYKSYQTTLQTAQKTYEDSLALTPSDIQSWADEVDAEKSDIKNTFDTIMSALGITYGQNNTSNLSSLQQGIQSITEEQAGGIEAYLNGVSSQVYIHTTLLQTISENFKLDLAAQSEMLLKMQDSYKIQSAINSLLTGWSNNSGRAVRVEIIS